MASMPRGRPDRAEIRRGHPVGWPTTEQDQPAGDGPCPRDGRPCRFDSEGSPAGQLRRSEPHADKSRKPEVHMADIEMRQPSETASGNSGDRGTNEITIRRDRARSVTAHNVTIRQGGARAVSAQEVAIRQGGAARVKAGKVEVTQGGVLLAKTKALSVTAGGVGAAIAQTAGLQQSWAQVVVTRDSVSLAQAAGGLAVSKTAHVRDSAVGLVLARQFHGEGIRILMGPRSALAFGAGISLGLVALAALRRRRS